MSKLKMPTLTEIRNNQILQPLLRLHDEEYKYDRVKRRELVMGEEKNKIWREIFQTINVFHADFSSNKYTIFAKMNFFNNALFSNISHKIFENEDIGLDMLVEFIDVFCIEEAIIKNHLIKIKKCYSPTSIKEQLSDLSKKLFEDYRFTEILLFRKKGSIQNFEIIYEALLRRDQEDNFLYDTASLEYLNKIFIIMLHPTRFNNGVDILDIWGNSMYVIMDDIKASGCVALVDNTLALLVCNEGTAANSNRIIRFKEIENDISIRDASYDPNLEAIIFFNLDHYNKIEMATEDMSYVNGEDSLPSFLARLTDKLQQHLNITPSLYSEHNKVFLRK